MNNFWQDIKKPFLVLAPMDDVTDTVFRTIVAEVAPPDVFFTEFTNVEGLVSAGRDRLMPRLAFEESHRKIVAQIWGLKPENYKKIAEELVEMGFDGIDINMGCPEKSTFKSGACSALIQNPELAAEIIQATKEGAAGRIPVSVKTRIGVNKIITEEWLGFLLKQGIAALTVHGRTVKEMSKVPAHWDEIGKAVKLRDEMGVDTLIIGNGDVENYQDAMQKVKEYGVDGVMIGRGIFRDIYAFAKTRPEVEEKEMLDLLLRHARLFKDTFGETKPFMILRKFFKIYTLGLPNASELRAKLMTTNSIEEVEAIVKSYNS